MRAVVQRVDQSVVTVYGNKVGEVGLGVLVLLAIHQDDEEDTIKKMVEKVANLRIFEDDGGKMNLSVMDIGGEVMVVSQFTLYGDTRGGNRPGFQEAARPEKAEKFYKDFVKLIGEKGVKVGEGRFGADMKVQLINSGPVTIIIDL